jgi:2-polyprenyl-3-methyl-5-hydroxy-6-metoxy-1,4-benzoquinol methylase
VQTNPESESRPAECHDGRMEAPRTQAYLGRHIISLCAELLARRVVDIGCGHGLLFCELATRGYEVIGCEPSAGNLRLAQRAALGLVFHHLAVEDDPSALGNESFDVAIATEVVEHLVTPRNLPRFRAATASARGAT